MSTNIYDSANQIEREIRQLPEFLALKEAFELVKQNEETFELFKQFQEMQMNLHQKQMEGLEISEEDVTQAQEIAEKVQASLLISDLMAKEQAFSIVVNDLNRIIMKPVQEIYEG